MNNWIDQFKHPVKEIMMAKKNILTIPARLEEGKTISINKLPDGKTKQRLESLVMDKSVKICIVAARITNDGTWMAYIGYPDVRDIRPIIENMVADIDWLCLNVRDAQQVRMMGDKLDKETATILFPDWDKEKYK